MASSKRRNILLDVQKSQDSKLTIRFKLVIFAIVLVVIVAMAMLAWVIFIAEPMRYEGTHEWCLRPNVLHRTYSECMEFHGYDE
jgi:uncharacterized membrane protein YdbT with pleckstrin-like domain